MTLLRKFLPHQQNADAAAIDRSPDLSELGLFLDMRLGKSMLLLRLWRRAGVRRALIAAPGLPLEDWRGEAAKELWRCSDIIRGKDSLELVAHGAMFPRPRLASQPPTLVLTTHETLRSASKSVLHGIVESFDAVAIDESTVIKNPKATLTKAAVKYLSRARFRAVLSGLPHPQDILEIWSQMAFLKGGTWMGCKNFWDWRAKYFYAPPWDRYDWKPTNLSAQKIRVAMHQDAVVMSAKEAGMERVVVRHTISSPLPPEAAKLAEKVRAKWQWPGFGDAHAAKNSIVVAGWLHALEGGCNPAGAPVPCWKPDALLRLLNEQVPENESVVVWATGKGEHVRAMDVARSSGRPCYLINGDTPPEDRQTIITEWREDAKAGDGAVLIVSPKLAKWGIDMSQANTQVWWSRSWSYEDNRQAEARTMHPTKKAATIIYDLVTSDESADAAVLEGLAERRENAQWYAERIAGKCPGS